MAERLSEAKIQAELKSHPAWQYCNNQLVRSVQFPSFMRGIQFMNALAHLAERQDHHPDVDIRYQSIRIAYWTHTEKGITQLDIEGMQEADKLITLFVKESSLK